MEYMPTKLESSHKPGSLFLQEIKFDYVFKRLVMKSGKVGKVYLPRELIGRRVYVVIDMKEVIENESTKQN